MLPVNDALDEMLDFMDHCLNLGENLLQHCLNTVLGSMEVIAQLQVALVMFLAVIVPMCWLAGNMHMPAHQNWGERSMGLAIDLLHAAFIKVREEPKLILDYEFIMTIFEPFYEQLPKFSDYMDYYKEEKERHVIGSMKLSDRVLVIDEAMHELFWTTKKCNSETTQYCYILAAGVATTLLTEL